MTSNSDKEWDIVIKPKGKFFNLNLEEIWRYRDLVHMYIRRDLVTMYKQTILGPFWYIIQPLLTALMQFVIFTVIASVPTDGVPPLLFYMAGGFCWAYFSECLGRSSGTFSGNAGVFSKVYFPRLVVPISALVSSAVKLIFQLVLFAGLYLYFFYEGAYTIEPNIYLLLFPFLLVLLALFGFGVGIIISSLTTKYRDLAIISGFIIGLWHYATPVVYPLSQIIEKAPSLVWLIKLNPLTSIVEAMRYGLFGQGIFSWEDLVYSTIMTIVTVLVGIITFNRIERKFVDVV